MPLKPQLYFISVLYINARFLLWAFFCCDFSLMNEVEDHTCTEQALCNFKLPQNKGQCVSRVKLIFDHMSFKTSVAVFISGAYPG